LCVQRKKEIERERQKKHRENRENIFFLSKKVIPAKKYKKNKKNALVPG
jgi:hypothetical protein